MWLEELLPNHDVDITNVPKTDNIDELILKRGIVLWKQMKEKKDARKVSYSEYMDWKLNFDIKEIMKK